MREGSGLLLSLTLQVINLRAERWVHSGRAGQGEAWDDEPAAWTPCHSLDHRVTAPPTSVSSGVSVKCC